MSRIAIIDDEPRMRAILGMVLRRDGHEVEVFESGPAFTATLEGGEAWDLVMTDLRMAPMDGLGVLDAARAHDASLPVVLITAHGTVETALSAMRKGAFDYIEKPFDNEACRAVVRRALERTRLARENRNLRAQLRGGGGLEVICESAGLRAALSLAERAAQGRATVLISGESGTGKELIARSVHAHSPRVGGPFVAVNCKALSSGVLESELFGHERGAFTGASAGRAGLFERADGGTLFLDEIGEVDLDFQGKLLRVLQEREVTRVGGGAPRAVDARVIAATNRDLGAEVQAGRFREDLYYRLAVVPIVAPPLRERREDVLPLARHFFVRFCQEMGRRLRGWSAEVEAHLTGHAWPGNVRELENTIERAVLLARGAQIELEDLLLRAAPSVSGPPIGGGEPDDLDLQAAIEAVTVRRIEQALARADGKRLEAAASLGVERTTLYRLMKKHGLG